MNYQKTANRGILSIKPYKPGRSVKEVAREEGVKNIIKMASNENPLGPSPGAIKYIRGALKNVFRYPEVVSYDVQKRMAFELSLEPENIIFGNGADGIIYAIAMTLVNPGDEVIIPEITFPLYETICRGLNGKIVFSGMRKSAYDCSIDLDDILRKITPKTKIIWLCNPNNPSGTMIGKSAFLSFYEKIPSSVMLVHDEVYMDFSDRNNFPDTIKLIKEGAENLFLIRSFSKVYGLAGVRLGFGMGRKELVNLMYRIRNPFDVSLLAEAACLGALEDKRFYKKSVDLIRGEREYLYSELDNLHLNYIPTHTNFILVHLAEKSGEVFKQLLKMGIIVRHTESHNMPEYVRVSIGTRKQNKRFIAALKKIIR